MKKVNSELLIDSYLEWYKEKVSFQTLKEADEIITPYVNHINDRISIFIEVLPNNSIKLSDDGVTLNELDMFGLNLETKTRKRIFEETLRNFNVSCDNEVLFVKTKNMKDFPQQKHNLLQSILRIYDLLFTEIPNVRSLFKEEVLNFLFENELGGNVSPKFQGNSGIIHSIDYSLGATKKRPNTLIKFQNQPTFANVTEQKFIAEDLKDEATLKTNGFKYVMITGEKNNSTKVKQAADYANIDLISFETEKEKILKLK